MKINHGLWQTARDHLILNTIDTVLVRYNWVVSDLDQKNVLVTIKFNSCYNWKVGSYYRDPGPRDSVVIPEKYNNKYHLTEQT